MTQFLQEVWNITASMAPYLLFGFFMAGLLTLVLTKKMVTKHLGKGNLTSIIKAAIIGVPMPLCSCSVIPVTISLSKQGAKKGPAISFLTATPQTGVDSILVTYSLLGPVYALLRIISAFVCGVTSGVIINRFDHESDSTPEVSSCCSSTDQPKNKFIAALKYGLIDMPRDLGKELLIGIVITATFTSLIPANYFADNVGSGLWGMLLMLITGIPIYVCSTASVPIAVGLIISGFSPGAVLVFLIAGPATNAASLSALVKIIGKKETIIYLLSLMVTALLIGFTTDYFNIAQGIQVYAQEAHEHLGLVEHISAVILLLLMSSKLFTIFKRKAKVESAEQITPKKQCCCSHKED